MVVNFAAESHVDRSIEDPAPFVSTNVVGAVSYTHLDVYKRQAPYHVAISLGDGSYVHAPTVGENVKIGYQKYFTPSYYIVLS